ncbi:MAG TPA: hypothetical protein VGB08_06985, partial [Allosphingosinicella sp.]
GGTAAAPAAGTAPSRRPPGRTLALAGAGLLGLAAAAAIAVTAARGPAGTAGHQPPPEAVEHYLAGVYEWERRTPESLARARDHFEAAIARDPDYAAAHAGLADAWLLLREYSDVPDEEAYARAEAAAGRALALDDRLADAHAALAFVAFYGRRDFNAGRRGFRRATELDPSSARAHHWHGTALLHIGEFRPALAEVEAARRLDPRSRSILADKGLILYFAGEKEAGIALLRRMAAQEPGFHSPRAHLAIIHMAEGDLAAWLAEAREAARLRGDADRLELLDAAARALAGGGEQAMLGALLAGQTRLHAAGRESFYALGATHALLGDRASALRFLEQALARREPALVGLRIDPAFAALRGDPGYRRVLERIG